MSDNLPAAAPVASRFQKGWRKHVYRTLAVMLALGIGCATAELLLRAVGYGRSYVCPFGSFHKIDPVLGWRGKPNFAGRWRQADFDVFIAHTEDGFRKLEHRKDPSQVNGTVFVLGDSFTWGYGMSQGDNFCDQLNLLLPSRQIEDFGLAGAGTVQEFAIFETHVQPRLQRGDTVLLAFFGNDFRDNTGRVLDGALHAEVQDGEVRLIRPAPKSSQEDLVSSMKDWSYLFNFLAYCGDRYNDVRKRQAMVGHAQTPLADAVAAAPDFADTVPEVQVTRHYLEKFQKTCAARNARLVVAYIPGQAELAEDDVSATEDLSLPEQIGYRKAFFRCAEQLGLETIDLLPYLVEAKKTGRFDRVTFRRDFHWTKDGHTVAAEALASVLGADQEKRLARKGK